MSATLITIYIVTTEKLIMKECLRLVLSLGCRQYLSISFICVYLGSLGLKSPLSGNTVASPLRGVVVVLLPLHYPQSERQSIHTRTFSLHSAYILSVTLGSVYLVFSTSFMTFDCHVCGLQTYFDL